MSKKRLSAVILTSALLILVFCLSFGLTDNALNQLPNITQLNLNLAQDKSPLKIEDIENLSERISMKKVSFCSELSQVSVNGEEITPVLTNDKYFEIYETQFSGEGITEDMVLNGEKTAVITSTLAQNLFFNTDAVGKTISLDGEEYKICGVIKTSSELINRLSEDGKQRVYIPYTSYNGYANCDLSVISYDNQAPSAAVFEQMSLTQYQYTNFSEKSKVIEDFQHILLLLAFIAICIISLEICCKLSKKYISEIRDNLKANYFLKSVKSMPLKYILLLLIALGIPALLVAMFMNTDFSIYIIPQYIPYDNIFDISHYVNAIVESFNSNNLLALTGDTYLLNLYSQSFNVMLPLIVIFTLILAPLTIFVYSAISKKLSQKRS